MARRDFLKIALLQLQDSNFGAPEQVQSCLGNVCYEKKFQKIQVNFKWVSFLPGEPAAAEVAKHSALHWSHVGTQSVHET